MFKDETATSAHDAPILVADPDAADRAFVRSALERAGFRVRSVAGGQEALTVARREPPWLAVLEVRLEDMSGYEVCRALKEDFGDAVQVMFVSGHRVDPSDRVAGLLIGADDYLAKPLAADELTARVRALGRRVGGDGDLSSRGLRGELTERELEVLQLLAEGLDQAAIAGRLSISHRTVGKHIEHILQKLPAHSRAEAVAITYRRGLHARRPPAGTV